MILEQSYQKFWNENMMRDCCWSIKLEIGSTKSTKKTENMPQEYCSHTFPIHNFNSLCKLCYTTK